MSTGMVSTVKLSLSMTNFTMQARLFMDFDWSKMKLPML
jgi:hypothetical protein